MMLVICSTLTGISSYLLLSLCMSCVMVHIRYAYYLHIFKYKKKLTLEFVDHPTNISNQTLSGAV